MADPEDLKLLQSGKKDLQKCDFSGHTSEAMSFSEVDFRGCILKRANFSGCDFENCDFREADLAHAIFANVKFVSCHFSNVCFGVNFDGSEFVSGTFRPLVTRSTFRGTKFARVDVKGIRFGEDNVLDDAEADDLTDFSGTSMPRALSRLPIFSKYIFERGSLILTCEEFELEIQDPVHSSDMESNSEEALNEIRSHLLSDIKNARLMCFSLSVSIDAFINDAPTPNEPEKLVLHENYISVLKTIRHSLLAISEALSAPDNANKAIDIDAATSSVLGLRGLLDEWWAINGAKVVDFGANVGLLGAGTAFLGYCGVPPEMATTICAILGNSKDVSDYVKGRSKSK